MRRTLQIILKIAERCNLNCSYCYYFNMNDETPGARPALMSQETVEDAARFLEACMNSGAYDRLIIVLHGGEPMLMPASRVRRILLRLSEIDSAGKPLFFGIQTNATLVTQEWLDLIAEFRVAVSVSLDGDQPTHDIFRVDKRGRPTHAQVDEGVKSLSAFAAERDLPPVTLLAVAGASEAGARAYDYFSATLGARYIDFILPDATHDTIDRGLAHRAETFLEAACERWLYDDARPSIPYFQDYVDGFLASRLAPAEQPEQAAQPEQAEQAAQPTPNIFTLYSDGRVTGNDYVRSMLMDGEASLPELTDSFDAILAHVSTLEGMEMMDVAPQGCTGCQWRTPCGGGQMLHRHSAAAGFDNPSVYCGHIQRMYAAVAQAFDAHMGQA